MCNIIYARAAEGLDRKERDRFDTDLNEPVGGWKLHIVEDDEGA